ncbi:zonular occludens toxin domain-containing protein [Planctomicrobium sp. SH527]|uniref:zonular occludens toxin domain-containing protein n=1 Tax=Planctomicrobium sp. SH527 TaxID=3448123 RepID=UPI003F5AE58C
MASRPQLECVIGESGAGKSLYVSAFLCVSFLRDEAGDYWHNLPLKPEGLAKLSGKSVEEVERRLKLIPASELQLWIKEESGPWDFFKDRDIKGAHVAIDEAHRYFGKKHSKQHLAKLGEWTGGLRHSGATAQLITQHEFKLATDARNEAGVQTRIYSPNQLREPLTGAKWYDCLQIMAKIRRKKVGLTVVREGVQQGKSARDFKSDNSQYIFHRREHYECYDSYNTIEAEGQGDGSQNRPKEEWERYSWPRLIVWYLDRNIWPTLLRVSIVSLVLWLFAFGGLGWIVDSLFYSASSTFGVLASDPASPEARTKSGRPATLNARDPQPTMAALPEDKAKLEELARTNQFLAGHLAKASEYAESLTSLVGVVRDRAYFSDGSNVGVGEKISYGKFAGLAVEEIDAKAGVVKIAGENVLRVGVLSPRQHQRLRNWISEIEAGPGESSPGAIPGTRSLHPVPDRNLQSGPGPSDPAGSQGSWRPTRNGVPQSNAITPIPETPRRSIRYLRGGGTGLGGTDSDSRLQGNTTPNSPDNSGPPVGGGTDRD